MTAIVVRADARQLPLPDASVDLIVTSPPYFALRSYTDGGEHYAGQVGSEPTPAEYIDALLACTREWMRVLKPSGSMWVNLGDKYAERGGPERDAFADGGAVTHRAARPRRRGESETGIRQKSLMGLPWRYALACIDQLGLILRAEVIWSKPNGLPESVTDRVRRSHEQWFHLVKQPRYFAAVDTIREEHARTWTPGSNGGTRPALAGSSTQYDGLAASGPNPLGKLPGSVWEIATEPLRVPEHLGVDHFAAFPTEFPRRLILGWSPSGICTACGEGRRPVATAEQELLHVQNRTRGFADLARPNGEGGGVMAAGSKLPVTRRLTTITGEACACPDTTAPTRPSVVADPFGGTGTTALVADVLGCTGISVDLSADYCRLATWRTTDPGERARAMRVPKPPVQNGGQLDMFGGDVA
jgi:DNA modification methylase